MCISAFFYIRKEVLLGGISILISGLFDALDGIVARAVKKFSFADKYFDKLGESVMVISLSHFGIIDPVIGIFCISGILCVELIKFMCETEGIKSDEEIFSKRGIVFSPRILIFLFGFYKLNIAFLIVGATMWLVFLLDSFLWFRKYFK
jgi:phosphatidylglycerophosphate synthase